MDRAPLRQQREDSVDRVAHTRADRRDVHRLNFFGELRRETSSRRREEGFQRNPFEGVRGQRSERFLGPGRARDRAARTLQLLAHDASRVLERLALEQAREQEVALLESHQLFVEIDVLAPREEAPRLQLDERRRDEQELGGDVEIDALHVLDLGAEHIDDVRERDLPEVDLFLQDEVQEEVERALENWCRDRIRHARRIPAPNHSDVVQRAHQPICPKTVEGPLERPVT